MTKQIEKEIHIRMPLDVRESIKAIAKDDGRSMASMVRFIITDYVREYEKLNGAKDD